MTMILTDLSNVTFYTFPADFDLHNWGDRDFTTRSKVLDRFGRHGAKQIAFRGLRPRIVPVDGAYHAASQAALKTFLDDLTEALHNNAQPYRFSWEAGFYINVSQVRQFKAKRFEGALAYKSVKISIDFECNDPFWYSTADDSTGAISITTSPQTIPFTNNGKAASPLKIQCDPTATWNDFTIENDTDEDNTCRYNDPAFMSGDQLIIDGLNGTVERDGLNTVRYFRGAFLRVLPGSNDIIYTGPTGGTITLSAPKRFL